ncbi:hypothetical protein [Streptomyces sp. NPDC049590]|uniref:hypothetical protein n=1 Tax=Streptomyces sp. NPDC049590 TaxID=3154834 RepID=UPI003440C1CC
MSADRLTEAGNRSEESEDDWRQSIEATLIPMASMVASILSFAAGDQRRKA